MTPLEKEVRDFLTEQFLQQAQITIDFFQDFEMDMFTDRDVKINPITRDEVGAQSYHIGIILDIMDDRKFSEDIKKLKAFDAILERWMKEIELRNQILGIPRERG